MEDDPRPTFISASLVEEEQNAYKALLYKNRDILLGHTRRCLDLMLMLPSIIYR
jgi:hypothetical protein